MAGILRRIAGAREWYNELAVGEKCLFAMAIGNVLGTCYGTYVRRAKLKNPESSFLVATTYVVPEDKKKDFEVAWSDAARLAQRQPGYEWTKTYKALDWEDSPFHYVSFRMWNEETSYRRLTNYDSTWKELTRRLEASCTSQQSTVYKTTVDDSVRRIIY
eukprot:TRINITY_DN40035_c0_g1_i1.p1 TRINITY_DN40035_c0_g1~~TRINITY_DN40035_c0_g1_i1.p1  ORF type:complete len:177 (-),score=37.02 TRINITY_DN40035_c0_g1_i1:93-572(-)